MRLIDIARVTELFKGLPDAEVEELLQRLNAVRKTYSRGETVMHAGFEAERMMVVASGLLHVYEQGADGRQVLVREIGPGEVLGLWILHVPEISCWPGTIIAAETCELLSLSIPRARDVFTGVSGCRARLAINMSSLLSRELFSTWRKLVVMDAQTIERRIEIYLTELDNETGRTGTVTVPFDRERMAEYFGVTRPALSRALGHMRDRGLLSWRKSVFKVHFGAQRTAIA